MNMKVQVNTVSDVDPIELLCNKMTNLTVSEVAMARALLSEFRDIFSVSNEKIGRTNVVKFDVSDTVEPFTVPLRRVPMHHKDYSDGSAR